MKDGPSFRTRFGRVFAATVLVTGIASLGIAGTASSASAAVAPGASNLTNGGMHINGVRWQ